MGLKDVLYAHLHNSGINNSWSVGATQVCTDRWVDKQSVVYIYNGILFTLKKEGNADTYYKWMNLEDIILL